MLYWTLFTFELSLKVDGSLMHHWLQYIFSASTKLLNLMVLCRLHIRPRFSHHQPYMVSTGNFYDDRSEKKLTCVKCNSVIAVSVVIAIFDDISKELQIHAVCLSSGGKLWKFSVTNITISSKSVAVHPVTGTIRLLLPGGDSSSLG